MYVTSATAEVDVSNASYTTTTTEVDNVAESAQEMKNRDEITGEQNVNRGIAIMHQQSVRDATCFELMANVSKACSKLDGDTSGLTFLHLCKT